MPIIPPSRPWKDWVRSFTSTVTDAADAALDLLTMAAYVPPSPSPTPPAPANYCAVVTKYGRIEYISDPATAAALTAYRLKTIEDNPDGTHGCTIIRKEPARLLRVGMSSSMILTALEKHAGTYARPQY
jgi:hypothetical protein